MYLARNSRNDVLQIYDHAKPCPITPTELPFPKPNNMRRQLDHFLDSNRQSSLVTFEEGFKLMEMILAGYESHEKHDSRFVQI